MVMIKGDLDDLSAESTEARRFSVSTTQHIDVVRVCTVDLCMSVDADILPT